MTGRVAVILALMLLATALVLPAGEHPEYRCAACGKLITGLAVVVDGELYHPECFRCAACGEPIKDEYVKGTDGKYYHRPCLERLRRVVCAYCGQPITEGDYISFEGKIYHAECYRKHAAPRCVICGKPLGDAFITDYWGNRFHPEHVKEYPVCQVCGRLVWQGGVEIDEGRWLCAVCAEMSVTSPERVRGILEEVRDELAAFGIVVRTLGLRIEMAERQELDEARVREGHSHAYAHVRWNPGQVPVGDETATIRVLSGLPEDMLRGIIAHELMHVWQHENGADEVPLDIREGSANWVSSLIYSRTGTRRGQFFTGGLEKSTDPVYGEGYRRVSGYADKHGVGGVLQMLKRGGVMEE